MLPGPRTVEGRLVGNFAFTSYQPTARQSFPPGFAKVARRIQRRAEEHATAETLVDLAFLQLLTDRPSAAVTTLERATALAPRDALLLSDLAAAYISRARGSARSFDFVRALSAADAALRLRPDFPEARFNRALALEKLALAIASRRAWNEVVSTEPDPGWADEAMRRLQRLFRPAATAVWEDERGRLERAAACADVKTVAAILDRFPQPARLHAEEELLSRWARQVRAGRAQEAERTLTIARAIGKGLLARRGDAMIRDAVTLIDSVDAHASRMRRQHLVEGHLRYGMGLHHYKRNDFQKARPELLLAEHHLRLAGAPFVHWATIYIASCDYFLARFEHTYAALERLQSEIPAERYPSLQVRINWILGSIEILRGRPGDALPRFEEGRDLNLRTGELDELAGMLQHLALIFRRLGDADAAWRNLYEGLQLAESLQSPQRYFSAFNEAGLSCLERGRPDVALYFQDELLAFSLRRGDPAQTAYIRRNRVRSLVRLRRFQEARHEIERAWDATRWIKDEKLRRRMESDIRIAEAEVLLPAQPREAAGCLTQAIRFYEVFNYRLDLPMAYFQRARAHQSVGEARLAEGDFRAGLAEIETVRESLTDSRLRIALQDRSTTVFKEIIALMVKQGRVSDAFEMSERGHARQLLEELAVASLVRSPRPPRQEPFLSLSQIQRELPKGMALVKYSALEDRLLIWSLRRESANLREVPLDRASLKALVKRVRTRLGAGGDRSSAELRDTYRRLIEPVSESVRGAKEIVFVPDQELALLSFAALVDPRTGRYLIEDHSVVVAPSANVYVRCLKRALRQRGGPPESVLAIGAGKFHRSHFRFLGRLRHAEDEAESIAAEYPHPRLLVDDAPTRQRFFDEMSLSPEVVHFAGHSVLNPSFPELSMLVLVPDPRKRDFGSVYSHEVYGLRLGHTRLAVLSACDTAMGRLSDSEGPLGLARPFLAAGVPAVLASLGPVDDEVSGELMLRFHRFLRAGKSSTAALRSAQLAQLAAGGDVARPNRWALFEIVGAAAPE